MKLVKIKCELQTEVEIIFDWFANIFQPIERTKDLVVTDVKFEKISHKNSNSQKAAKAKAENVIHQPHESRL